MEDSCSLLRFDDASRQIYHLEEMDKYGVFSYEYEAVGLDYGKVAIYSRETGDLLGYLMTEEEGGS